MNILALDPATKATGVAYASESGDDALTLTALPSGMLVTLSDYLDWTWEHVFHPDLVAFEDAAMVRGSAYTSGVLMNVRGIIQLFCDRHQIKVKRYAPASIKKFATGNGRADKEQMMRACETFFGFTPDDDNISDARFILEMAMQGVPGIGETKNPKRKRSSKKKGGTQSRLFK